MPTGYVILPLLCGYIFLQSSNIFRFRAQREDGYHLLIECILAGIPLAIMGRFMAEALHNQGMHWVAGIEPMLALLPVPFIGTGVICAAISLVLALTSNLLITPQRAKWFLIRSETTNGFLHLAHEAIEEDMPIAITLESKKVYVGFVIQTPSFKPGDQYLIILPLISGYRKADTLELEFTTYYDKVYEQAHRELDAKVFGITVPLAQIHTASRFDLQAYPLFDKRTSTKSGSS